MIWTALLVLTLATAGSSRYLMDPQLSYNLFPGRCAPSLDKALICVFKIPLGNIPTSPNDLPMDPLWNQGNAYEPAAEPVYPPPNVPNEQREPVYSKVGPVDDDSPLKHYFELYSRNEGPTKFKWPPQKYYGSKWPTHYAMHVIDIDSTSTHKEVSDSTSSQQEVSDRSTGRQQDGTTTKQPYGGGLWWLNNGVSTVASTEVPTTRDQYQGYTDDAISGRYNFVMQFFTT